MSSWKIWKINFLRKYIFWFFDTQDTNGKLLCCYKRRVDFDCKSAKLNSVSGKEWNENEMKSYDVRTEKIKSKENKIKIRNRENDNRRREWENK